MVNRKSNNKKKAANKDGVVEKADSNQGCILEAPVAVTVQDSNACPYNQILEMISGLDLQDDGIVTLKKIKDIETVFCTIVVDEKMLSNTMEFINNKALDDCATAVKFAMLFSSRKFNTLLVKGKRLRNEMLNTLELNYNNTDTYRIENRKRLYNSIILLGEYYHRVRLNDNTPISILGKSLLNVLIRVVKDLDGIDQKLAKLMLTQITLNANLLRISHEDQLEQLMYHLRRNLIELKALTPPVKALLFMCFDVYYSNMANLGDELATMYTRYLFHEEPEGNNMASSSSLPPEAVNQEQQPPQPQDCNAAVQDEDSSKTDEIATTTDSSKAADNEAGSCNTKN